MTKSDFYLLRNSITMRQVAEYYNFKIIKRGGSYFTLCPFHNDKNASMQIFDGFKGFYCRGCGQGGDVTKFIELFEGVTQKEAAIILSNRFHVPISENGEVSPEALQKAQQAEFLRQELFGRQLQIKAELRLLGTLIKGYEGICLTAEPYSEIWIYAQNELPRMIGRWEILFERLRK
jgi:DNA primase